MGVWSGDSFTGRVFPGPFDCHGASVQEKGICVTYSDVRGRGHHPGIPADLIDQYGLL
ncbi:hypothetical protein D3C78_1918060 [compost metagenome]